MRETDIGAFSEMLDKTCRMISRGSYVPDTEVTAMYFRVLAAYPIEAIRAALDAHARDAEYGMFVPVPAHLILQLKRMEPPDGRPGEEEAWAAARVAADEFETVVWTTEMAQAWALVTDQYAEDQIGARMAFKEAYARMVREARAAGRPVEWVPSLGYDAKKRERPIREAVALGRLPQSALAELPAPAMPLLQLLDRGATEEFGPTDPALRERIRNLTEDIRADVKRKREAESPDAAGKRRTAELKTVAQIMVEEYEARVGWSIEDEMREGGSDARDD